MPLPAANQGYNPLQYHERFGNWMITDLLRNHPNLYLDIWISILVYWVEI